jgi:glyoxylase-like metal-dependent hydrolase (beta-lactamase superfamily II)
MKYLAFLVVLFISLKLQAQQPLQISRLTGDLYVFTTYKDYDGEPFPANGMYAVTNSGVILIDMPWDTTQTLPLLDSIRARHHKEVVMSISTHFHDDRTGGITILQRQGVKTYSSVSTKQWCKKEHKPQAQYTFSRDTVFTIGGLQVQTFYPGPGHTQDNIVVWFPQAKVLYGGCFIKSMETDNIGNLSDADPRAWVTSLHQLVRRYPAVKYVVPGHQAWSGPELLQHTLDIVQAYNKNKH